jgi:hypothetical protein
VPGLGNIRPSDGARVAAGSRPGRADPTPTRSPPPRTGRSRDGGGSSMRRELNGPPIRNSFFYNGINFAFDLTRTVSNDTRYFLMGNHHSTTANQRKHTLKHGQPSMTKKQPETKEPCPVACMEVPSRVSSKVLNVKEVNFDDFRSPGLKRTPLLERRNMNTKPSSLSAAIQAKPQQLFEDPRSPNVPRTPVADGH